VLGKSRVAVRVMLTRARATLAEHASPVSENGPDATVEPQDTPAPIAKARAPRPSPGEPQMVGERNHAKVADQLDPLPLADDGRPLPRRFGRAGACAGRRRGSPGLTAP